MVSIDRFTRLKLGAAQGKVRSPLQRKTFPLGPILILLVFLTLFLIAREGYFDWRQMHERLEPVADRWWAVPLMIALQAILYALALPGSAFLVIVPLFFPPLPAAAIAAAGGAAGALLAYVLVGRLGEGWRRRVESRRTFKLLKEHSDFLALCAMRVLPGFPHAVINHGGGALRIPLGRFVTAALLGFAAKGYLYAVLIYGASHTDDPEELIRLESTWPLFVLAALLVAGRLIRQRWSGRETP